jgi:precorrin-2 dehydrogenase / sirohydrochlorin ferrochelatase
MSDNNLYIACIDLRNKPCLVVGAGPVALEKVQGLLAAGARVTVVAPAAIDEIVELEAAGAIALRPRPFEDGDLDSAFLVIVASGRREVGENVSAGAEARSMLCNVADVPDLCNFILPAVTRRGRLVVAISTMGASPALAKRMRDEVAGLFGEHHARFAELLEEVRPWAKANLATYQERRLFFEEIVFAHPDPIDLLRQGEEGRVRTLIRDRQAAIGS